MRLILLLVVGLFLLIVVNAASTVLVRTAFGDVVVMRIVRHDFSGGTVVLGPAEPVPLPPGDGAVWRMVRLRGAADFLLSCSGGGEQRDGYLESYGPWLLLVDVSDCRIDRYEQHSLTF